MGPRGRMLALAAAVFGGLLAFGSTVVAAEDPAPPGPSTTTTTETSSDPAAQPTATGSPEGVPADSEAPSSDQGPSPDPGSTASSHSAPSSSSAFTAASSGSVSILDGASTSQYRFSPSSITVGVGDAVTWTNEGNVPEGHTVSGDGFDSPTLHSGQSYTHTFSGAGTFDYVCTIHPFMKGTVKVEASGSGGGGGAGTSGSSAPSATPSSPTSESAAGASPDAAGSADQLPSTGLPEAPLLAIGAGLFLSGLALRRLIRIR